MLAGDGARAVLIGTGAYACGSSLPDVPQVAGTLTALGQCLTERCGLAAEHLTIVRDPDSPMAFRAAVAAAATEADDTLVVYYTGHGLLSADQGALHLATSAYADPRPDALEDQALPFRRLVDTVNEYCRAASVIVILDCCYSGRASAPALDWAVLKSAGWDQHALVPAGDPYPAYTGELIRVLTEGDQHGPPELTLLHVHEYLTDALAGAGMPTPQAVFGSRSPRLVVTRNRAYTPRSDDTPGPDPGEVYEDICPYRGLEPYTQRHERFFSGRAALTDIVIRRMADRLWTGGPQFVIGASGSGKSSLLAGGVLPGIGRGGFGIPGSSGWPRVTFLPGADPVGAFAHALADVSGVPATELRAGFSGDADTIRETVRGCVAAAGSRSPAAPGQEPRLIVVIDQAEEVFTLCPDEAERHRILTVVAAITGRAGSQLPLATVALGLRSEFFTRLAGYPQLGIMSEPEPVVVGAMTALELRAAITEPAAAIGLRLEAGLADLLIEDIGADPAEPSSAGYDPGALPLLSYALLATWQQKSGPQLTIAGYRIAGRVKDALRRAADGALAELSGSPQAQQAMRELLLQLVSVGPDRPASRRRMQRDELIAQSPDRDGTELALGVLIARRLVTTDGDQVQLTHEALISAWPALQEWINQDRDRGLARQELADQATRWEEAREAKSYLYHGEQLLQMRARLGGALAAARLGGRSGRFLAASTFQERRRKLARRGYTGLLAVIAVTAVVLAVVAYHNSRTASQQRDLASQQRDAAAHQRDVAASAQAISQSELLGDADPAISRLLSIAAWRLNHSSAARYAMLAAAARPGVAVLTVPRALRQFDLNALSVESVAFSPDGKTLASGYVGGSVVLWDVATGQQIGSPLTATGAVIVDSVAFSPDGKTLASGNTLGTVVLWDVATHQEIGAPITANGALFVFSVAFSPDGKTLASMGVDGKKRSAVWLWDVATHRQIGAFLTGNSAAVTSEAFSPGGKILAIGSTDGTVQLWDVATGQQIGAPLTGRSGGVSSVAFSPGGKILAIGNSDGTVQLWDVATHRQIGAPLGHSGAVSSVAFSADGMTLAIGSDDGTVQLWDMATRQQIGAPLAGHNGQVFSVAFSLDSKTLASGSDDGTVRLWSVAATGQPVGPPFGQPVAHGPVAFSPNGKILASGNGYSALVLWDVATGHPIGAFLTGHSGAVLSVAFSLGGKILASGSTDGTVRLWDVATGEQIGAALTATGAVSSVAFSPDGKILAGGSKDGVWLWDVATGRRIGVPIGNSGAVGPVAFRPDGKILASGGGYSALGLWDITTSRQTAGSPLFPSLGAISSVAFSPDGEILASGGDDGTVRLWDVATGQQIVQIGAPLTGQSGAVFSVAFSPDGNTVASGSDDGTVRLWDVATSQQIGAPLAGHNGAVFSVAFSPDGKTLASGGVDGVRLWDTAYLVATVPRLCASVGRSLTRAEWAQYVPPGPAYQEVCA